jgi:hypothetical protein
MAELEVDRCEVHDQLTGEHDPAAGVAGEDGLGINAEERGDRQHRIFACPGSDARNGPRRGP